MPFYVYLSLCLFISMNEQKKTDFVRSFFLISFLAFVRYYIKLILLRRAKIVQERSFLIYCYIMLPDTKFRKKLKFTDKNDIFSEIFYRIIYFGKVKMFLDKKYLYYTITHTHK